METHKRKEGPKTIEEVDWFPYGKPFFSFNILLLSSSKPSLPDLTLVFPTHSVVTGSGVKRVFVSLERIHFPNVLSSSDFFYNRRWDWREIRNSRVSKPPPIHFLWEPITCTSFLRHKDLNYTILPLFLLSFVHSSLFCQRKVKDELILLPLSLTV